MTSEKIMAVHHALGELAGRVPELEWGMLRLCRAILEDCAEQVEHLEEELEVPGCGQCEDYCRDVELDIRFAETVRGCGCKEGAC